MLPKYGIMRLHLKGIPKEDEHIHLALRYLGAQLLVASEGTAHEALHGESQVIRQQLR